MHEGIRAAAALGAVVVAGAPAGAAVAQTTPGGPWSQRFSWGAYRAQGSDRRISIVSVGGGDRKTPASVIDALADGSLYRTSTARAEALKERGPGVDGDE